MTNKKLQDSIQTDISFEGAFKRLEEILEKMNSSTVSLDESLKLYEEADQLIVICTKRLNEAGKRIEILTKNRNGELILTDDKPSVQDFKVSVSLTN